jgi:hypothetical protein
MCQSDTKCPVIDKLKTGEVSQVGGIFDFVYTEKAKQLSIPLTYERPDGIKPVGV